MVSVVVSVPVPVEVADDAGGWVVNAWLKRSSPGAAGAPLTVGMASGAAGTDGVLAGMGMDRASPCGCAAGGIGAYP